MLCSEHSQLSNIIGHICVSSGYLCSFIGHDNVADILQRKKRGQQKPSDIKECESRFTTFDSLCKHDN